MVRPHLVKGLTVPCRRTDLTECPDPRGAQDPGFPDSGLRSRTPLVDFARSLLRGAATRPIEGGLRLATQAAAKIASMSDSPSRLPTVVFSSVVRSTKQSENHGGVYLLDLETERFEQKIAWDDPTISLEGRGGDRGLRGIAFHDGLMYLAASDEIFVYDRHFQLQRSFKNRYLKHCHEIWIAGNTLFATSTGFDSVLAYDLLTSRFERGYCLRFPKVFRGRRSRKLHLRPRPIFRIFDPESGSGPAPGDTCHINSVCHEDGTIYVCGAQLGNVWAITGLRLRRYARVPYGSHNSRPFRGGVIMNHTATDRIAVLDLRGRELESFPLRTYDESQLQNGELSKDLARQAFGRGLALPNENVVVGGSSPATITAYQFDPPRTLKSVNVSIDIRNAVHGLEIWPFDDAPVG